MELDIRKFINDYQKVKYDTGFLADNMDFDDPGRGSAIAKGAEEMNEKVSVLAEWMHDNYEEIAKNADWETQESCRVKFDDLPENNKRVMLGLSKRILESSTYKI